VFTGCKQIRLHACTETQVHWYLIALPPLGHSLSCCSLHSRTANAVQGVLVIALGLPAQWEAQCVSERVIQCQ